MSKNARLLSKADLIGEQSELFAATGTQIKAGLALLVERAVASGEIRCDIDPLDLLRALVGLANASPEPDGRRARGG